MFARIGRLVRGFLGLFISGIEEANPEALMEAARLEFRTKMTQYNLALARMGGVAERLKGQVKGKAVRAQELERRILANHRAGNMELAGTLARELQELKADLETDSQELKDKIFKNMSERASQLIQEDMQFMGPVRVSDVEQAQQKIVDIVRRLEDAGEIIIAGRGGEKEMVV